MSKSGMATILGFAVTAGIVGQQTLQTKMSMPDGYSSSQITVGTFEGKIYDSKSLKDAAPEMLESVRSSSLDQSFEGYVAIGTIKNSSGKQPVAFLANYDQSTGRLKVSGHSVDALKKGLSSVDFAKLPEQVQQDAKSYLNGELTFDNSQGSRPFVRTLSSAEASSGLNGVEVAGAAIDSRLLAITRGR